MREPIENISLLQKQINNLQLEKSNPEKHSRIVQVFRMHTKLPGSENRKKAEGYDPDQGARIIHPGQITVEMANLFYARFWGTPGCLRKTEREENPQEKQDITHSVTIGGRTSVPKMRHEKMNCKDCPPSIV